MKLCLKSLAILIISATTYFLIGCAAPASFSYQNVAITLTVECGDCGPVGVVYNPAQPSAVLMVNSGPGGVYLFTAHVTNAPANVTWTLYPTPNLSQPGNLPTNTSTPVTEGNSSVGTVSAASGSTAYYTQNGVPVYTGASLLEAQSLNIPQGDSLLVASVPSDPNNPSAVATASQLIQHYNQNTPTVYLTPRTPTTPANLTNPVVTVSHLAPNNTFQFVGGAVGTPPCTSDSTCLLPASPSLGVTQIQFPLNSTDNQVVWEVGPSPFSLSTAVVGGSTTYGTISPTGLYTAPAAVPAIQPVVVMISHVINSVNAFAYVGVN